MSGGQYGFGQGLQQAMQGGQGYGYRPAAESRVPPTQQPQRQYSGLQRFGSLPMWQPAPYQPRTYMPPQLGAAPPWFTQPGGPGTAGGGVTPVDGGGVGGPGGIGGAAVGGSSGTAGQAGGIAASGLTGGIPGIVAALIGAAATGAPANGAAVNAAAQGDPIALDNAISQISADPNIGPPAPTGQDAAAVNDTIGLAIGMDVGTTGQNPDGSPVGSVGNQGESGGVGGDGGGK